MSEKDGYLSFIDYPLILMYGNFFYRNIDGEYWPAEIGMAKFTFADGLDKKNRFQTFVDPGKCSIPIFVLNYTINLYIRIGRPQLGYMAEAKDHVERTHRTPVPGMDESIGDPDMSHVNFGIMNFLKKYGERLDNRKPIVFTYTDKYSVNDNQVNVLKSFMRLFSSSSSDGGVEIDIFPLEQLFITLRKVLTEKNLIEPLPNDSFADIIMSRDPFDVVPGVSCKVFEVLVLERGK